MIFKKNQWNILIRVFLLILTITGVAFLLANGYYTYVIILLPIIIYQVVDFFKFHLKQQAEVEQFVESVHYRDFSRHFDVKHAPDDLKPLRKGFNEINTTFKVISKEKEIQYYYLQKILELVDTGILSYEHNTGNIAWMNDGFKKMFGIPYLKTIHSLSRRDEAFYKEIIDIRPGDQRVCKYTSDKSPFKVLLSATAFQTGEKIYKLIAFQNVTEALDETEAQAWKKLLSVMTHEIMNSVAPISSLADTLKNRLQNSGNQISAHTSLEDLELGIDTIKRRSEGLLKFAETYRNLNKITKLNLKKVYTWDLFESIHHLMQPTLEQKKIEMEIILKDPDLMLEADTNLVEQVLINLVVNAIEAVKDREDARIVLSGYLSPNNKVIIKVSDNGIGMPAHIMDKIFIPFFSTRKTGSGIGLSLCKQIMMLHKGNVHVSSIEGEGTSFFLAFLIFAG